MTTVGVVHAPGRLDSWWKPAALSVVLLDCVDGKLAREALDVTSDRGKAFDELADGQRHASGAIGLGFYLLQSDAWVPSRCGLVAFQC